MSSSDRESFEEFQAWRESIDSAPQPVRDAFDRLSHQAASPSQEAMDGISHFLATQPDLPRVMLGVISHEWVGITFEEEVPELPEPWEQDGHDLKSWRITYNGIPTLEQSAAWGDQMLGLYSPGNNPEYGDALLYNTEVFQVLGLLGEESFIQSFMIGHVLQKAYETWNDDELLILVGYGEQGRKIQIGTREVHPPGNVILFDDFDEITAGLLEDNAATIFWWGSDATSVDRFKEVQGPRTGLVMDSHDERTAFIADEGNEMAALEPNCFSFQVHATYADDTKWKLIEVLWSYFEEDEAKAMAEITDESFDEFLSSLPESDADSQEQDEQGEVEVPETAEELLSTPRYLQDPDLKLLGEPEVFADGGSVLVGKPADAVALIHLSGGSLSPEEICAAIWPHQEAEGKTARQRRRQLRTEIAERISLTADAESWRLPTLVSDYDQAQQVLDAATEYSTQKVVEVLEGISTPLEGCAPWSATYTEHMTKDLVTRLQALPEDLPDEIQAATAQALERITSAQEPQTNEEETPATEPPQGTDEEDPTAPQRQMLGHELTLLGKPEVTLEEGSLAGKPAEAVALIHLHGGTLSVKEISEAIWPGKEAEGNTARQRRRRLKSDISDHLDITADTESWSIPELRSDYDQARELLEEVTDYATDTVIEALTQINPPLEGCPDWAEPYRKRLTEDLTTRLEALPEDADPDVHSAAADALERLNP